MNWPKKALATAMLISESIVPLLSFTCCKGLDIKTGRVGRVKCDICPLLCCLLRSEWLKNLPFLYNFPGSNQKENRKKARYDEICTPHPFHPSWTMLLIQGPFPERRSVPCEKVYPTIVNQFGGWVFSAPNVPQQTQRVPSGRGVHHQRRGLRAQGGLQSLRDAETDEGKEGKGGKEDKEGGKFVRWSWVLEFNLVENVGHLSKIGFHESDILPFESQDYPLVFGGFLEKGNSGLRVSPYISFDEPLPHLRGRAAAPMMFAQMCLASFGVFKKDHQRDNHNCMGGPCFQTPTQNAGSFHVRNASSSLACYAMILGSHICRASFRPRK